MTDENIQDNTQAELNEHETRIVQLEKQVQEHLDGWKRAKADYLNLKKQTDKEKQDIAQFAVANTVVHFLPVYDDLARALKHVPEDQKGAEWVKGVMHIRKRFEDALKTMGLDIIPTVGQQFDPVKHYAVSKVKVEGVKPGTIVDELKSGFTAADRVLEPAQVVVAE